MDITSLNSELLVVEEGAKPQVTVTAIERLHVSMTETCDRKNDRG